MTTRPAWSFDRPVTPVQARGGQVEGAHAVSADATRANGGNGQARRDTPGTLPEASLPERPDRPETHTGKARVGFDAGTSKRVQNGASATVDVFENADGSVTRRVYSQPVNFRATDGTWQPIDTSLRRDRDGRLRNTAGDTQVSFAAAGNAAFGRPAEFADTARELVSVVLPSGQSVTYGLAGAAAVDPAVSGSTATYTEILPQTDLELVTLPRATKETLVLKSAKAGNEWVFPLRLGGLTPRLEGDGSISLLDVAGKVTLVIPPGSMWDSKRDAAGEHASSSAVKYELTTVDGAAAVKVTADAAWLNDPARVFPVMVDPTIAPAGNGSTFVQKETDSSCCTNNNSGATILKTGYHSSGPWLANSFVKFDEFSSTYMGYKVTSATFKAHVVWVGACAGSYLRVYDVAAWTPSGVTNWNNQPALWSEVGNAWGTPNNDNCVVNDEENPTIGQWWGVPMTAAGLTMINRWTTGGTNNGVAVISDLNANNANWKKIASVWTARPPHFEITYTPNELPQVEGLFPPHGHGVSTLTPELIVKASDLDNQPKPLTYRFQVYDASGVNVVADSGTTPIASSTWMVPAGSLEWGKAYVWAAVAFDGAQLSPAYPAHAFTTSVPQPLITSGLAQNSSAHGFEPNVGNYTTQVTDANIPTTGPALAIQRSYNSRDPRSGSAFGAGWSSVLDARLVKADVTMTVTYPSGQDVAFGLKADGSYAPPSAGLASSIKPNPGGGYLLTDQGGTKYLFGISDGTDRWRLSSITDAQGRILELEYNLITWRVASILSKPSGRRLYVRWTTTGTPHVDQVSTDQLTAGDAASANYWRYVYVGDKLDQVCRPEPATLTACSRYTYGTNTLFPTAVLDARPHTYLRLNEAAGAPAAASSTVDSIEPITGIYSGVSTVASSGLPGSTATAANFNGTSSNIELVRSPALWGKYQTLSVRFRTEIGASGVIYSLQGEKLPAASGSWNPALYVGTDGKLRGELWHGSSAPLTSTPVVNDGAWHHAVLTVAGNTQTLYLDGAAVGTTQADILLAPNKFAYIGAGKWRGWPGSDTNDLSYFRGQIADFAFYAMPLNASQVATMRATSIAASAPLTMVKEPSGNTHAVIEYDTSNGTVTKVTDANGGQWQVQAATRADSGQVYRSAVLGGAPHDYYRFADTGPSTAINEVNGGVATYNQVSLGVDGGPLGSDLDVASFNGSSSHVLLPTADAPGAGPASVSMWFRMPLGSTAGGVLYGYQNTPLNNPGGVNEYVPALYVGTDGRLRGHFWVNDMTKIMTGGFVNDGRWHHVMLAASTNSQALYLDGVLAAPVSNATLVNVANGYAYVGAGNWYTWPSSSGTDKYFAGEIAEFAFYKRQLKAEDAGAQFAARTKGAAWLGALPGTGSGAFGQAIRLGQQCADANSVTGAGDLNSDGKPDVVCRTADGTLHLYRGNGTGGFIGGPVPFAFGFGDVDRIMWPGDFSGDGKPDLIVRRPDTGNLLMFRGNGEAGWITGSGEEVGWGWVHQTFTVGDFSGDGKPDFFACLDTGQLLLYRGNGTSGWLGSAEIAGIDCRGRDMLGGRGDINGDAKPDVIFRSRADNHLYYWRGDGTGGLLSNTPVLLSSSHADKDAVFVAGDFTGDGLSDLIFRSTTDPDRPVPQQGVPTKVVNVLDPDLHTVQNVYDLTSGRQIETVDARGKRTTIGYDSGGFARTITDPNKNVAITERDSRGNVKAQTSCQDLSANLCSTIYFTYYLNAADPADPRNDKLLEVRDARSSSETDNRYLTRYTYDAAGNLTEIIDPLGRKRTHEFTDSEHIIADFPGLNVAARYVRINGTVGGTANGFSLFELEVYGLGTCQNLAFGRPAAASSVYSNDPVYNAAKVTDGIESTRWNSAFSDPQWIRVDLGALKVIDRIRLNWRLGNGKGYQIQLSNDDINWNTITTVSPTVSPYVPAGLPSRVVAAGGAAQQVSYTASGDVARTVDAAGLATCFKRDQLGRVVEQTVTSDIYPKLVTKLEYDRADRVTTMTEPLSANRVTGAEHTKKTTNVYNLDGALVSTTFSDTSGGDASRTVTSEYNTLGQKKSQLDGKNNKTQYEYDLFGRQKKETAPDGTITEIGYDFAGNQTTKKVNGQTIESKAYDDGNRLSSVTDAMGWQTLYSYTDNNLVATETRKDPTSGATYVVESNVYDKAGNLITQTTNNGITTTSMNVDAAGRVAWKVLDAAGVNRTMSYGYNADDNVVSQTVSGATGAQTVDSLYDPAGRLIWQGIRIPGGTGGPDSWWQLNEQSGTVAADSAAAGRNATVMPGVTWSDNAVSLNGTGDLYTSAPVISTMQSFSISVWAKVPAGGGGVVVSQDGNWRSGIELVGGAGSNWYADKPCGEGNWGAIWLTPDAPVVTDKWTHLGLVFDSTTSVLKLYVDGQFKGSASNCGNGFDATGPFIIGRGKYNTAPSGRFVGSVDNVAAYRRVLNDAEILSSYNAGRGGLALTNTTIATSWTRDKMGNVLSETDPNGNVSRFTYDEASRLVQTQTATVEVEENDVITSASIFNTTGYDTFGGVVDQRDGRGLVTHAEYDANGQVTKTVSPDYVAPGTSTPITAEMRTAYTNMGRVDNVTDPLGRQTFYTYDQFGQVKTVKTPDLGITTYNYHADGQLASVVDPLGARSEATHDFLGRQKTTTQLVRRPGLPTDLLVTNFAYYPQSGWLEKVISPNAARGQTRYEYNNVGEVTRVINAVGDAYQTSYDFAGRPFSAQAPDGSKKVTFFDAAGRPTSQQELSSGGAVLRTVSATYDGNGNVLTSKDGRGTIATINYDALGRVTRAIQPFSATESITTTFGYDANSQATRYTDGRGAKFRTNYNAWNLPESTIEPGGNTYTTVYDGAGRVDRKLLPGGVTNTMTYDVMDNLERVAGAGAETATTDRVYDYDDAGRLVSLSGPGGTNTLSYDDRGLLLSVTGPSGNSSYGWTSDGLMSSRTDAAGTTNYTYDTVGRLKTLGNTTAGLNLTYDYNNLSQVSQITYGSNQNRRVFGYDTLHRLKTDELKTSTLTSLGKITYDWDLNNNEISKVTEQFAGAGTNTYTYDLANRLTGWNSTTYAYDRSGNRTQAGAKTFYYDTANRLTSASDGTQYEYTPRGTLKRTTVGTVSLDTISDAFNQVYRQYSTATAYSQYSYDGLGRVIQAGFAYTGLGNDLAADPTATYVRDPGGGLAGSKSGANSRHAWTDLHGDVVGQFTATGTSLSGSTTYEPFGKVVTSSGTQGSLGYQSEWTDAQTKRVNMHARWYNPETGQFDSRDTVGVPNRYSYAGNNPLTKTDPTGHWETVGNEENVGGFSMGIDPSTNGYNVWRYDALPRRKALAAQRAKEEALAKIRALFEARSPCKAVQFDENAWGKRGQTAAMAGCSVQDRTVSQCERAKGYGDEAHTYKNCTTVIIHPDGSATFNGVITLSPEEMGDHDPRLIAKQIDFIAGSYGGYTDGPDGDRALITALALDKAIENVAQHQAEVDRAQAKAKCDADTWCRNKDKIIGGVLDFVMPARILCRALADAQKCDTASVIAISVGAGIGCGFISAGTLAAACAIGVSGAGNVLIDYTQGNIQSGSDVLDSFFTGAAVGALTMGIGAAASAATRGLGAMARMGVGMAVGAGTSALEEYLTTGQVTLGSTLMGTVTGGIGAKLGGKGGRGGGCLSGHSFDPSTKVATASGATVAIGSIQAGDKVVATDPETGETGSQPVTALHLNLDTDLVDVTVEAKDGSTATLHTTGHHPFWDATSKQWVNAADLKAGESTLTGPDGQVSHVVALRKVFGFKHMRDLTVDAVHTYFVIAGDAIILVHNSGGAKCPRPGHLAPTTVYDANGKVIQESTYFSGRQIPEEMAQGKRKGAMASHTEARITREGGEPWAWWHVGDDPVLGTKPFVPGSTYYIEGELPPCSWCSISMEEAAVNHQVNFVYTWMEDGVQQFWWRGYNQYTGLGTR